MGETKMTEGQIRAGILGLGLLFSAFATVSGMVLDPGVFSSKLSVALLKFAAMITLAFRAALPGFPGTGRGRFQRLVVLGLVFEALCDFLIEFNLVLGGCFSILGMVSYSLAFTGFPAVRPGLRGALRTAAVVLAFTGAFVLVAGATRAATGTAWAPVDLLFSLYMAILASAVGLSWHHRTPGLYRAAIIVFFVSDIVVYWGGAYGRPPELVLLNSLTYYPAQVLFAVGHPANRKR